MSKFANSVQSDVEIKDLEIWNAIARIQSSRTMARCARLSEFLRFIVKAKLHGQSDYLKETSIGMSVFGREPDYDPKIDTVVRSEAWRLRRKLKEYYESEGVSDPLIIDVPRGHYVPYIRRRQ